ncbi:SET domain-containing protein [Pilatotrama ljubarskyi]|nr:SET domain-containing protein [Pilatotrama ljubarskyi]
MSDLLTLGEPENTLRLLQDRYVQRVQQRVREEREVSTSILQVYRTSWSDFYAQEPAHSSQLLRSLEATVPLRPRVPDVDDWDEEDDLDETYSTSCASFVVWSAGRKQISNVSIPVGLSLSPIRLSTYAYPKYESCTPSLGVIQSHGDPLTLQFIPYADEPRFQRRIEPLAQCYARFAWQAEWYDADFKLIAADAVLHLEASGHTLEEIERFKPYFMPALMGGQGLIPSLRRRDLYGWGSDILRSRHSTPRPSLLRGGLLAEVNHCMALFCSNINCNAPICMPHGVPYPPITLKSPEQSNEDMYDESERICRNTCFRQYSYEHYLEEPLAEEQDISDMLKLHPDRGPCALAKILRTTCYNVFHHRCFIFPDGITGISYNTGGADMHESVDFCIHAGSCSRESNCVCIISGKRCQRQCRCRHCHNRRKPCKCIGTACSLPKAADEDEEDEDENDESGKGDEANHCECADDHLECDPDTCKPLSRKRKKRQKHCCKNMRSQLGNAPLVSVKIGSWGLGAFAEGKIKKNTFIGEYISEAFPTPMKASGENKLDQAQGMVNTYRGLNYMFNLEGLDSILDAATVGNMTRCLNDPRDKKKANVQAETMGVGDNYKILFFARKEIKAGEELLLWYGENYWASHDDSSSEDDSETRDDHD